METFWASIFVFGLLIFFHELGHFIVAKSMGIKVNEFSLGFGPKIIGYSGKETAYNVRLFPLGGFVRMAGMEPGEQEADDERGFNKRTVLQRMLVIIAGPLMNFFLAVILLALIFMLQGIPAASTVIDRVIPDKPAALAGLLPGDKIIAVNDMPVKSWQQFSAFVNNHPGEKIILTVSRNGEKRNFSLIILRDEQGQGKIGVLSKLVITRMSPLPAMVTGVEYTVKVAGLILNFIGKMIVQQEPADLGGPVRIISEINKAVQFGFFYLLQLAAFLSINLGLFNLFPIPALDGSRLLFLTWEGVRGKPVDPAKENFIHLIGFGLLLLLMVIITYNDVLQMI